MRKIFNSQFSIFNLISHPLFTGSFVMVFGNNFANFLNAIYHFVMGKLLLPALYGDLAAVLSLFGIATMIPTSLGLVIVKFVASAKSRTEIGILFSWLTKVAWMTSVVFFVVLVLLARPLASFLQLESGTPILLLAGIIAISLQVFVNRSILQGLLRFIQFVISLVVETGVKLIGGILLVLAGFSVSGAIGAMLLGAVIAWALTRFFLKDYSGEKAKTPTLTLVKYALPVVLFSLSTTSLLSTDLLLVKHFFQPHESGIYAATSVLGRIIFWGTAPISAVMFPMISQRVAQKKPYLTIFALSVGMTLLVAVGVLGVYLLFPKTVVALLYRPDYFGVIPYLLLFGLFVTFFSLSSLILAFFLSLGKTTVVIFPIAAAIVQAVGIWLFHESISTVILVSLLTTSIMMVCLLVYLWYASQKTT